VYEFGVRLEPESVPLVDAEIARARALYNSIIAVMRETWGEIRAANVAALNTEGRRLLDKITYLDELFSRARQEDDREALKKIALERKEARLALYPLMGEAQAASRESTRPLFSRVGAVRTCATYQLRCSAVAQGLGFATANAVLDSALLAWKNRIRLGRAPKFCDGATKIVDTLTLQFADKRGGIPAAVLLAGQHREIRLKPPEQAGKRKYGTFEMRIGSRAGGAYFVKGSWQYHRQLPPLCSVRRVRLVRKLIGGRYSYWIHFLIDPAPPCPVPEHRAPLAAIHFGWASSSEGRRIGAMAYGATPSLAKVLYLPESVELDLKRASSLQSDRSLGRDRIVKVLKEVVARKFDVAELNAIARLPAQRVGYRRLLALANSMGNKLPEIVEWSREDRLLWRTSALIARRARNRRRDYYRQLAIDLVREYSAIGMLALKLDAAAELVDPNSGEHSPLNLNARAGRALVAISELRYAIEWAAQKSGTLLFEVSGKTSTVCASCGGASLFSDNKNLMVKCKKCGAKHDRGINAAVLAWQWISAKAGWLTSFLP
jgi:hypothetical protein